MSEALALRINIDESRPDVQALRAAMQAIEEAAQALADSAAQEAQANGKTKASIKRLIWKIENRRQSTPWYEENQQATAFFEEVIRDLTFIVTGNELKTEATI